VGGSASGGTGYSISPRTLKGARLVTSPVRPGQDATSPASSDAASSRCSRWHGRAERAEHRRRHERRALDRGEPHEGDAVGEEPRGLRGPRRLDGEAGLANASGAGEREQPHLGLR
jgi:hypothetical protein